MRMGEDNIEVDKKGTGYEDVVWIHLSQDRDHHHGIEPSGFTKRGEFLTVPQDGVLDGGCSKWGW